MTSISQVICPVCMSLVPVPTGRVDVGEACQACKSPLFNGKPITLTSASFDLHARASDLPLFVIFWMETLPSMTLLSSGFDAAAAQLEPDFRLGKVDVDDEPVITEDHLVSSVPTYVVIHHGRMLSSHRGLMMPRQIIEWPKAVMAA